MCRYYGGAGPIDVIRVYMLRIDGYELGLSPGKGNCVCTGY